MGDNVKSAGKFAKKGQKSTGPTSHTFAGGDAGSATEKSHDVTFAKGGNTPMFSEQQASPQTPAHTGKNGSTGKGAEFAKGGSNKMFGFAGSQAAQAGITSAR